MRASTVEQVILETLSHEHAHLTSLQVFEGIRERLPALNQSTVYRALERLVKQGKVTVSDMGTGSAVYELLHSELHHHLVCQNCGCVETIGHEQVGAFLGEIAQRFDFKMTTNHLVLFGMCARCREEAGAGM